MNNLVSIIIPTFNRADRILFTINSIKNQTHTNWECLIIDGNSTDNSESIIPNYFNNDDRFRFYTVDKDQYLGPNSLRNYGFKFAKGNYVYFFDSDDLLKPNALECYLSNFHLNIDAVIAKIEKVDSISGKFICNNRIKSEDLIIDYFKGSVSFYICGPMWKKSFLDQQDILFDENIRNLDDFDFNLRMIYSNPNIVYLNDVLSTYVQYPNSLKKELLKLNKLEIDSAFKARYKHLEILKNKGFEKISKIEEIIIDHRKEILRRSIVCNSPIFFENYFLVQLYFIKNFKIISLFKLIIGTFLFKFFKKGYSLLK